ncbi:MAG: ABC transporter permease subunit [Nitriliruptorales bacterium]|nr:ABC transporter permease subunit [Nitriliruptorales bacterium]
MAAPPSAPGESKVAGGPAPAREPADLRAWLGGRSRSSNLAIKTTSLALLLALWQLLAIWQGELLFPGPVAVVQRLVGVIAEERFAFHMAQTLLRVGGGLAVSLALAMAVGIPMGLSRPVERFIEPYVLLGLTIPGLAWALIAVMVVGITNWAPVLAIVASTTPMVMLNLWQGAKSLDTDLLQMGTAFRASRALVMRQVVLPQLFPFVLAGTRLGLALAWKIVVLSEMFGLSNGVGYQLSLNFSQFSIAGVMAWTIAFTAVMAAIEFGLLRPIEHRVTRWRPSVQGA